MSPIQQYFITIIQKDIITFEHLLDILTVRKNINASYPYQIHRGTEDTYYHNEDKERIVLPTKGDDPLLTANDLITLPANTLVNQDETIDTTIGRVIANHFLLITPFGKTIPYINGYASISDIESLIAPILIDDGAKPPTDKPYIYVDQYLTFLDSIALLEGLTPYITYAATPKNLVGAKGIAAYKKKLSKEYEGRLDDPIVAVEYQEKLRDFDKAYLKDDPSYGKFMSGKVLNKCRLKMFGSFGSEDVINKDKPMHMIEESLADRLPDDKYTTAALNSSTREASFSRGNLTQLGGVISKTMAAATGHLKLIEGDCGTKRTVRAHVYAGEEHKYLSRYHMVNGKPVLITKEILPTLVGKDIALRSVTRCIQSPTAYCQVCSGDNLVRVKDGINLAATEIAGIITSFFLALMHGKVHAVEKIDLKRALGRH